MKYKLIFITTCTNTENISILLDSILSYNSNISVLVVALFQLGSDITLAEDTSYSKIVKLRTDKILNSSCARNFCTRYIKEHNIDSEYIMFPDDDSSFDSSFFENFDQEVSGNTLINVYCRGSKELYQRAPRTDTKGFVTNYKDAMSVNMIVCFNDYMNSSWFDENMGVGAKYGAGEDGDMFLQICKSGGLFFYNKNLHNYHPSSADKYKTLTFKSLVRRYKNYGKGVAYLLYKHKKKGSLLFCVLRGFLGAFYALIFNHSISLFAARLVGSFYRAWTFIYLSLNQKRFG